MKSTLGFCGCDGKKSTREGAQNESSPRYDITYGRWPFFFVFNVKRFVQKALFFLFWRFCLSYRPQTFKIFFPWIITIDILVVRVQTGDDRSDWKRDQHESQRSFRLDEYRVAHCRNPRLDYIRVVKHLLEKKFQVPRPFSRNHQHHIHRTRGIENARGDHANNHKYARGH